MSDESQLEPGRHESGGHTATGPPDDALDEVFSLDEEAQAAGVDGSYEPELPPDEGDGPSEESSGRQYKDETLWTKFNIAGGVGRRCRVSRWLDAGRVIIDLSETDAATNKLKGSTAAFVKAVPLGTWLRAVTGGYGARLYPPLRGGQIATPENFMIYGGGIVDGQPVSRVFKAHHWPTTRDDKGRPTAFDDSAFMWRTVIYKARRSDQGAFIPIEQDKPVSTHSIKINRVEMAEISYALDMALINQASRLTTDEWLPAFTGRRD